MRDVEGIGRGLDALRAARKPVLICAPEGRSEAARRSIVAHTGALAGDTGLRDAWLTRPRRRPGGGSRHDVRGRRAAQPGPPAARPTAWRRRCSRAARARCSRRPRARRGCRCRSSRRRTKAKLRRALPHYASQNNPLDVTGQAAVETDMFCDALDALAHDPRGGRRRHRRVPAADGRRVAVGRPRAGEGARAAARDRRGVRERGDGPARVPARGRRVHEAVVARSRSCRDTAPRRAPSRPSSTSAPPGPGRWSARPAHPNRAKALRLLKDRVGAARRGRGRARALAVRRAPAEGAHGGHPRAGGRRRPRDRLPGGREGPGARTAAQGAAGRRASGVARRRRRGGGGGRGAGGGAARRRGVAQGAGAGDGGGRRGPGGRRGRRPVRRR